MSLDAGRLKHRIEIQALQFASQANKILLENADTMSPETGGAILTEHTSVVMQGPDGEMNRQWVTLANVWAAIEPLSAREFISASKENSKVSARITIRSREDIDPSMRILHRGRYYNIEGLLPDKDSGLEYITIPVSEGLRGAAQQA